MSKRAAFVLMIALSGGCVGRIGDLSAPDPAGPDLPNNPNNPSTPPGVPPPPANPPPPQIPPFAPAEAALRRLTRAQYVASVIDLLGDVRVPEDLEVDTPLYGFSTVGASSLNISPRAAEQFEAAALDLAAQVFADDTRRTTFVGCSPAATDDPCIATFISTFARRAWRRPITPDELTRWTGVVSTIGNSVRNVWTGLEMAVAGMLESPNFLYRVELGLPDPANANRMKYTSFELATRLAYFITGTTPDAELLDAAERGELDDPRGIEREARRLLALPKTRAALGNFFDEHLKLDRLDILAKDAATYPQLTQSSGRSMKTEIRRIIEDVVFDRNADLRDIFQTRDTFVNDDLARIYGLSTSGAEGFERASHPANSPRAGILTTAGFLALNAHASVTSPTNRGKFIRQALLCQEIPPPPPGVVTTLPDPDPNTPRTLRQRMEALHYSEPSCAGCHLRMDPIGFGLENFDAIGAYRTTDNGLPVDPRGELDGRTFKTARELAQLIHDHPRLGACLSRMAFRYATGHLETDGETETLVALAEAFEASGYKFRDLAVAIVTSDGFRYAAVPN